MFDRDHAQHASGEVSVDDVRKMILSDLSEEEKLQYLDSLSSKKQQEAISGCEVASAQILLKLFKNNIKLIEFANVHLILACKAIDPKRFYDEKTISRNSVYEKRLAAIFIDKAQDSNILKQFIKELTEADLTEILKDPINAIAIIIHHKGFPIALSQLIQDQPDLYHKLGFLLKTKYFIEMCRDISTFKNFITNVGDAEIRQILSNLEDEADVNNPYLLQTLLQLTQNQPTFYHSFSPNLQIRYFEEVMKDHDLLDQFIKANDEDELKKMIASIHIDTLNTGITQVLIQLCQKHSTFYHSFTPMLQMRYFLEMAKDRRLLDQFIKDFGEDELTNKIASIRVDTFKTNIPQGLIRFWQEQPDFYNKFSPVLQMCYFLEMAKDRYLLDQFIKDFGESELKRKIESIDAFGELITEIPRGIIEFWQDHPDFYHYLSSVTLRHEMGNRLGLEGINYESYQIPLGIASTKMRFNRFFDTKNNPPANSNLNLQSGLKESMISSSILEDLNHHGSIASLMCGWEHHVFSFNFIRDGEATHIIYVNRGAVLELAAHTDPPVLVFTLPNTENLHDLIGKLLKSLQTDKRAVISRCIRDDLNSYFNQNASTLLKKSSQKVGNCAIANANILWHFRLASEQMKQNDHLSFMVAYQQTLPAYKVMRMKDRADAFCDLILHLKNIISEADYYHALKTIMIKMYKKELASPEKKVITYLLNTLLSQNSDSLVELYDVVTSESFLPKCNTELVPIQLKWEQEIGRLLPLLPKPG
jgi:hypothetical protein